MWNVWWIAGACMVAGPVMAGTGTNELLRSSPSPAAPPGRTGQAAPSARPTWDDPRSLLDESRPPSPAAGERAREAWRQRDLPKLDQTVREMERRGEPERIQEFMDDVDWYLARQKQQEVRPLPKPPLPPEGTPAMSDVTQFELAPAQAPATQPATRPVK